MIRPSASMSSRMVTKMKATAAARTSGAAGASTVRCASARFAHDGRLRLWANGLAFSRSVIRTGVPGSSKNSRKELTR